MSKAKIIVIIDDRLWKSIVRDITTLCVGLSFMAVGSFLDNNSMEVAGFLVWALYILSKLSGTEKCKTIGEARNALDEMDKR